MTPGLGRVGPQRRRRETPVLLGSEQRTALVDNLHSDAVTAHRTDVENGAYPVPEHEYED